jgi:hypothetical protein
VRKRWDAAPHHAFAELLRQGEGTAFANVYTIQVPVGDCKLTAQMCSFSG